MQQSPAIEAVAPLRASEDPRQTWVISDGRAGNHRQALALAHHLHRAATEILVTTRKPWSYAAPRVLPFASRAFEDPIRRVLSGASQAPALVIGCGRQAALATRLLRARGSFAIQILNPRLPSSHWDIVIAPEHDGVHGQNILTLPGSIHDVTPSRLATVAQTPHAFQSMPSPRVALLIGGDTHNQSFDQTAFAALLEEVKAFVRRTDGSLLISNSRRTPQVVSDGLRDAVDDLPSYVWTGAEDAARLGEFPHNPYSHYLALSDVIVCSADSVSMLSEAAATRAQLFVFGDVSGTSAPSKFARQLIELGRAQVWTGDAALAEVTPLDTNGDLVTRLHHLAATLHP